MLWLLTLLLTAMQYDNAAVYEQARLDCDKSGETLLVLAGADWCKPCQNVNQWLPHLKSRGRLIHLNVDQEQELAEMTTGAGPIPRLAVYQKVKEGWRRSVYVNEDQIREYLFPTELVGSISTLELGSQCCQN